MKPVTYIGIDIAKRTLDVAGPDIRLHLTNTPEGHEELLAVVRLQVLCPHFIFEPCGSYSRGIYKFLHAKRCRLSCVNPFKVRQFGKALGQRAKTDQLDAELLAAFGETFKPKANQKPSRAQAALSRFVRRRRQLVLKRMMERQQREHLETEELRHGANTIINTISREIMRIEESAKEIIAAQQDMAHVQRIALEVDGVGPITTMKLLAALPELGTVNRRKVAALAGLAPYNADSGEKEGVRRIEGGREIARHALYMAARKGARCNPVLAPFYARLRAQGKPHGLAISAVMRKLLIYLNALARTARHLPNTTLSQPIRLDPVHCANGPGEVGSASTKSCDDDKINVMRVLEAPGRSPLLPQPDGGDPTTNCETD